MFWNKVRTVPPRPKNWRLLCWVVLPFFLSRSLRVWAYFADPYQRLFLTRYVKDAIHVTLGLGGKHALADYTSLYNLHYHAGAIYVLRFPLGVDLAVITVLYLGLRHVDYRHFNKLRRDGRQISGPVLHTPKSFEKTVKGDGIRIGVAWPKWVERFRKAPRSYVHIPRTAEREHFAVSGAPGSGKTTTLQWIVDSIKERNEREGKRTIFVFFDPHNSFIQRYWKPGAWVANPFDARGFSWCPTWELDLQRKRESKAKVLSMAKSVYVGKQRENAVNSSNEFFTRSSQLLYGHLVLNHQPSQAQELAYWMDNPEEEIETRVVGKLATDLDHGSMGQRNGILSSFTMPQQAFEAIPLSGWWNGDGTWRPNAPCWTAKDFCLHRDADLFLTSDANTIDALQPYYSMILDMIFRQIISMGERPDLPEIVVVIDEGEAAGRLPYLQKAANQIRKFGGTIILSFQSRSQLVDTFGEEETTAILAAMKTQIYHRVGENKSAKWQTENIGEIEYEELHETWNGTGLGKRERQVSTQIKRKFLFKPSDFTSGMGSRESVLRFDEGNIVKYRVALSPTRPAAPAFLPRPDSPVIKDVKREKEPEPDKPTEKDKEPKPPEGKAKKDSPKGGKTGRKSKAAENDNVLIGLNITTLGND